MAAGDITADRAEASDQYGASFDGVDDKIAKTDPLTVVSKSYPFSISLWVFAIGIPSGEDQGLFKNIISVNDRVNIALTTTGADLRAAVYNGSSYIGKSSGTLTLKNWSNIIYTFDGSTTGVLYINGIAQVGANNPATADTAGLVFGISNAKYFQGLMREIRIYSEVLSASEIALLVAGQPVNTNLVHYWKLGSDYNDSVGTAHGTNTGTYFTKTKFNELRADADSLNLAAATDKIIALPVSGRDGKFTVIGANRAAA